MRWTTLLLTALGLAGCGATSEHPLSTEADSLVDERIVGHWEAVPKESGQGAQERLIVGRLAGTERTMEVAWLKLDKSGFVRVERYPFHVTRLEGQPASTAFISYDQEHTRKAMEARNERGDEALRGYLIYRYRVDGDVLTLGRLNNKAIVKAIRAKKIQGTVADDNGADPQVHITEPVATLRAWLAKAPATIWDEGDSKLRRVVIKRD